MMCRAALILVLVLPSAALAQEAISTAPPGAPPAAEAAPAPPAIVRDDPNSPDAIGRWANAVLAGEPTEEAKAEAPKRAGCIPPTDGKPHGEVWAGIGTGGYRNVGGMVTVPLGECGYASIAVDKSEFDAPKRRRR